MKKWKKVWALSLAAAMSLSLAGCGGGTGSTSSADSMAAEGDAAAAGYDDELHIAFDGAPDTLDLTNTSSDTAVNIMRGTVFETLVSQNENYEVVPELAESYEMSEDATTYTYYLRENMTFHNGEVMDADDVAASMNRWLDNFSTAADNTHGGRFEKVDDITVQIVMPEPYLYLNELIATAAQVPIICPASVIESSVDPTTNNLTEFIGTGPYMFDEWAADQYIRLVAYEDYVPYGDETSGWTGIREASTPTVYWDIVTDEATQIAGMQSGEYDMIMGLSGDNYEQFASDDSFKTYTFLEGDTVMIYNKREGVASDAAFRRAVNMALNCDDIAAAAYGDPQFYTVQSSYMSVEESPWYSTAGSEYYNTGDTEGARALLEEIGYNGEEFRLLVGSDQTDFYNAAIVIEQQLEAAGINVTLVAVDWATYLTYSADQTMYDAFITSFSVKPIPTLITYLSATWNGWCEDPVIQDGLASINAASDLDTAVATWNEIQQYCWEEGMPVSKLCDKSVYCVTSSKVDGLDYFRGLHPWNVTVEQ